MLPRERRAVPLVVAAAPVHAAVSLLWGVVLEAALRRPTPLRGGLAGLAIAAIDLGLIGRRFPRVRALPLAPQLADHVVYGAVVAAALRARR